MNFEVHHFIDEIRCDLSRKNSPQTIVREKNAKNNLFDVYDHPQLLYTSNMKKNNFITGWSEQEAPNPHLNEQKIKIDLPISHRINKPKQKYSHAKNNTENTISYLKNQLRKLDSPEKSQKIQQSQKKIKYHKKRPTKISQMIKIKQNSFNSSHIEKAIPIITTFVIPEIVPLRTITERLNFNSIQGRVMQYAMMQTKHQSYKEHREQSNELIGLRKKRKWGMNTTIRDSIQGTRSKELKATTCQKFKLVQLLNT